MTRVIAVSNARPSVCWLAFLALLLISIVPLSARGATVTENVTSGSEPERVEGRVSEERLVVDPEPEWHGWGEWHDGWHDGGPRIDVWVDRGDWATYWPGDRLWVYFRVDRPCFVTIIDYAPDGRVDVVYPNRWSGSNFVRPGRTYRVPESRRYSLRIAGPGGVEKLVACAHQAPWPGGPRGYWIPPRRPRRGRVVVGRPGGHGPPGRPGRVVPPGRPGRVVSPERPSRVVSPGRPGRVVSPRGVWPVPHDWHDRPSHWGCDSVSFYVAGDGWWHDGAWDSDPWHGGDDVFHDRFKMRRCVDSFYRDVYFAGRSIVISIECTESRSGDPTEIVGRVIWGGGWDSQPLFRIDVEGRHGDRPVRGRVYAAHVGPLRIEVEIDDFEVDGSKKRWTPARIDWIRFDVRAFGGR